MLFLFALECVLALFNIYKRSYS